MELRSLGGYLDPEFQVLTAAKEIQGSAVGGLRVPGLEDN